MTIVRQLNTAFTGGDSDLLPFFEHGTGSDTVTSRWLAKRQAPADGETLPAFTPSEGTISLASSGGPIMATDEYGSRVVRFDGVDDAVTAAQLEGVGAITLICRVLAPEGTRQGILHTAGSYIRRGEETPSQAAVLTTGGSAQYPLVELDGPLYHVVSLAADGSNSRYDIDGVTGTIIGGTALNTEVTFGRAGTTNFGRIDVLEGFVSTAALTLAQMASVRTAMKDHYGDLLA